LKCFTNKIPQEIEGENGFGFDNREGLIFSCEDKIKCLAVNWFSIDTGENVVNFAFTSKLIIVWDVAMTQSLISTNVTGHLNALILSLGLMKTNNVFTGPIESIKETASSIISYINVILTLQCLPQEVAVDFDVLQAVTEFESPKNNSRLTLLATASGVWTVKISLDGLELPGLQSLFNDSLRKNKHCKDIIDRLLNLVKIPNTVLSNVEKTIITSVNTYCPTSGTKPTIHFIMYRDSKFVFNIDISNTSLSFVVIFF
jgi:hypothetical protein